MHHNKKIKARKDYHCIVCHVCIPVGAVYIRTAEICDGKWRHSKWHTECRDKFDGILRSMGEYEGDPEWTWEDGTPQGLIDKYNGLAFENILRGKV